MLGAMNMHGPGPLAALPIVASVRLVVEFADGSTGTIDVPGATSVTFDVEVVDDREITSPPLSVIGSRREVLVIRVVDPRPFTVTVPAALPPERSS